MGQGVDARTHKAAYLGTAAPEAPVAHPAPPDPAVTEGEGWTGLGSASLSLTGIRKQWPKQPAPVLDGVDLSLEAGDAVWIQGRNGAGKTTLLRIAAGLIAPDSGRVSLGELDVERSRRDYQRQVGFLSAGSTGIYARLSVEHHLDYWARIALLPGRERRRLIERALDRFELRPLKTARSDRISMGQRQRLRVAMAFLHEPRVVLLDEPTNSLDPEGAQMLAREMASLCAAGGAALWCSPSADQPALPAIRTYLVADGRLHER